MLSLVEMDTFAVIEGHIRKKYPGLVKSMSIVTDKNGLHIKLVDDSLLSFTFRDTLDGGLMGLYFSSGNAMEWPYKEENTQGTVDDVVSVIDEYFEKGAKLEKKYVGGTLASIKLKIGDTEEVYVKKIKLLGKRKVTEQLVEAPSRVLE